MTSRLHVIRNNGVYKHPSLIHVYIYAALHITITFFILLLSLALADLMHAIVTTFYLYPPIILKRQHLPLQWMKIFNAVDWIAWAITLTHISAVCLDRLAAIIFYGRYTVLVSMRKMCSYSIFCWIFFIGQNIILLSLDACCMIIPLQSDEYYTFGYQRDDSILNQINLYIYTYTPLELATIVIISVSNPIILIQLYKRWKRKCALQHNIILSQHILWQKLKL
uniref:7TM_GPCR_Srx domain-containing protein n=1 Tax=Elaeophora elaphi TaxID=1147741 RepID=A0A0R3RMP2_9BILA